MNSLLNLKKNIITWYPIKKNQSVLQIGNDEQIFDELKCKTENLIVANEKDLENISEKFDFVVMIGSFENLNSEKEIIELLNFAKNSLKENGKILLAMQNKFGMQYWTGEKANENLKNYETIVSSQQNILSLPKIKKLLNRLNLNSKFYYPLPDYKITNVIYTDEFIPDNESIDSRVLTICDENEILSFSERESYKQLIAEEKSLFPFFSNSFFLEISSQKNFEDIRFVSFGITRNKEYSVKTIIKGKNVYKTSNDKNAEKHINNIADNIKILNECNINNLDKFENHTIVSSYLEGSESLDNLLNKIYKDEGINSVIQKIKIFNNEILNKLGQNNVKLNNTVFEKYKINVSENLKGRLHFTKNGLYDLIFQNCLVKDNKFYIFDQEWYEENIPIEFILYRAIFYLGEVEYREQLYQEFNLSDYLKTFEELEKKLQKDIINEEIWNLHSNSINNIGRASEIIKQYENSIYLKDNHIKNLEKNIDVYKNEIDNSKLKIENLKKEKDLCDNHIKNLEKNVEKYKIEVEKKDMQIMQDSEKIKNFENGIFGLRKGIEDLTALIKVKDEQLVHYANDIRTITNSKSWKIISYLKYILWALNPRTGVKFIDRIMPPGGKRRIEYEKKKTEKQYEKRVKKYIESTDEETVEYWKGIDHRKYLKLQKLYEKQAKNELNDYEKWLLSNMTTEEELNAQRKIKFKKRPKISILVPLYNTDIVFFKELLYTVHCQTYTNWELCLADGSPKPLKKIEEICKKDCRIKYHFIGENKGISGNTNEAIKLATGDYISLLDHDDLLTEDCLYEVVKVINENPDVDFIYTDEDKIELFDESEFSPHFKPDFAPDTLRSQNYICHFSVFRKDVMDKLVGFRSDYDGAQDYDIILRMSEIVKPENIKHISKILYHWRVHKESTAMLGSAKTWAFDAGRKAVEDHIKRIGLDGIVNNGKALGTYEVEYKVEGKPKVNILIPNKDGIEVLKVCIDSILNLTTYDNYEIDIIENNSTEKETFEYYEKIKQNPKVKIIYYQEKGFNYSRIINFGVKNSDGDFVIQLNNDTEVVTPDWLEKMIGYAQQKRIGAVGVRLNYPDNTIQHAGVLLGLGGIAGHLHKNISKDAYGYFSRAVMIQNMTAVTAACIMTRREIYEEVGYMNEELAVAFNDIDFCMKIRKLGYLIIYNPYVELLHYESKTRGSEDSPEKVKRFNNEIETFRKAWFKELEEGDPYYNKNLRLDNDQYEVRTDKVN